jgi:MEDS: MEthanogen/methylotroph, DcmR Sensory domain
MRVGVISPSGPHRERVLHGASSCEHIVHFFDDETARECVVAAFVKDALAQKHSVLIAARPALWRSISAALAKDRVVVSPDARLVVLDAYATLAQIMRQGRFEPHLFQKTVAQTVSYLAAAAPLGVSAYGELVDILAAEGNFTAARELEAAWNELIAEGSLTLLCGYSSAHFAPSGNRGAMSAVCAAHTRVETDSSDALGRWLLGGAEPTGFVS